MIIIINGSVGVGKSSVAAQLHYKFPRSLNLDADMLGDVHPFEIYDDQRIEILYRALALLVSLYQQNGYDNFVINYVFESAASLQELIHLLEPFDREVHVYGLTCMPEVAEKRIRARKDEDLDWELKRTVELESIQSNAAQLGFIGKEIDTSNLTLDETTDLIWADVQKEEDRPG